MDHAPGEVFACEALSAKGSRNAACEGGQVQGPGTVLEERARLLFLVVTHFGMLARLAHVPIIFLFFCDGQKCT